MSDVLYKKLDSLDKASLIEIITEVSSSGKDGKKLVNSLLNIRDPKAMYKELKKEINAIKRGKRFIDYRNMYDFSNRLFAISEKMKKYMLASEPDLTLSLCKQLIDIDSSLFERIDDSNGDLGSFYYDLFEILDKALGASKESAESIVDYVMETALKDDYGNRSNLPEKIDHCLRDDVISCFVNKLEVKPYTLLESQARADAWENINENLISLSILKNIADKKKDVDEYIRLCRLERSDEQNIYQIAKRLNATFRTEEAIYWLNKITSPILSHEKSKLLQEAYHLEGDQEQEKQVIWDRFSKDVEVADYIAYLKILPNSDKCEAKERAYHIAVEKSTLENGLQFLWDIRDFEAVENTYFKRIAEVNDRSFSFYRKLSTDLNHNSYPLAAITIRRNLIDQVLSSSISKYYKYALSDLNQMIKYSQEVVDWKGHPTNVEYLKLLHDAHYRKYSFWDHVDYKNTDV